MSKANEDLVAALSLATGSVLGALVKALIAKGLFSKEEMVEIYDTALVELERQHGEGKEGSNAYKLARLAIEATITGYTPRNS